MKAHLNQKILFQMNLIQMYGWLVIITINQIELRWRIQLRVEYLFKQNYLNYFTTTKDTWGNTYIIKYENPSYYGNLKVVGIQPSNQNSIYSYKLYQNGFTQNTIDKNGNSLNIYTYMMDALSQQSSLGDALILGFGGDPWIQE